MGVVYQAVRVDDIYRKLVALKIVARGLRTRDALRKFETERHILAHLDHPNIAKLLDGGTTADGQPWFVMDFIAGTPIDEYCDAQRLGIPERLKLFLTVCSAVQYAHQNFVVHRDIKPRNIMVTAEGAIRLLDFGIAKLLDPDAEITPDTVSIVRMMTPEYASPEQLFNQPVTTASDTWSLGVLLYVLLTGHMPFAVKSRSARDIAEAVANSEPRRPSSVVLKEGKPAEIAAARGARPEKLARALAGDLDNILIMALGREPDRRYRSAEALANDIQRHLDGLPVLARENSLRYRAGKFVRRHKGAVLAAGAAAIALIAGSAATAWEAHVANRERERAERRLDDVRRVANSLLFDLQDAVKDLPESSSARAAVVSKASEFLDSVAADANDNPSLARELATSYERLGDIQSQNESGGIASYRRALALREKAQNDQPADADLRREIVANYGKLSDLLWRDGSRAEALGVSRKALDLSSSLAVKPGDRQDRVRLAAHRLDYGYKLASSGVDPATGLEECRKSLGAFSDLASEDPDDATVARFRTIAQQRLEEVSAARP
jgi:non-specific serine/threonine protein kinase/serine/threonine-protein kinase